MAVFGAQKATSNRADGKLFRQEHQGFFFITQLAQVKTAQTETFQSNDFKGFAILPVLFWHVGIFIPLIGKQENLRLLQFKGFRPLIQFFNAL